MNSPILDVALGLSLVFATFALVASGLQEGIAAVFNLRGKMLFGALNDLAGQKAGDLLNKDLLTGISRNPAGTTTSSTSPSYIPSWLLAAATLDGKAADIATQGPDTLSSKVQDLEAHIGSGSVLSGVIQSLVENGANTGDKLETALATWYDGYMDRVSGWYKRRTQWILLVIGISVALVANVDAVGLTRTLINDPGVRTELATKAAVAKECGKDVGTLDCANKTAQDLPVTQIGLFWAPKCQPGEAGCPGDWWKQRGIEDNFDVGMKLLGLLIGGFAISLGAPFWFDLIGRGVSLKGAGPNPPLTPSPASEPTP